MMGAVRPQAIDNQVDMGQHWSEGAHSASLMLDACKAWWAYCNASPTRGPRRFAAFMWHSAKRARAQLGWLHQLDACDATRLAVRTDPQLYERWLRPYLNRHLSPEARQHWIADHWRFVMRQLPQRLRDKLLLGHDLRIASLPLRDGDVAFVHVRKPADTSTGELGLFLLDSEKRVLASCALVMAGHTAVIGDLRGPWHFMGAEPVRRFTRESHGVRPKDLLLAFVRALGVQQGWTGIRSVSASAQVVATTRDPEAYDKYWREHGGVLNGDGCFDLPCQTMARALHSVPSRKRAAHRRKQQFREDACRLFLRSFQTTFQSLENVATNVAAPGNANIKAAATMPLMPLAAQAGA